MYYTYICIYIIIKRGFIRLTYMIGGWIAQHTKDPENPEAAQFKKLEASEQGGPMMQPQSKTEGLEEAWRVAGLTG
jgi:hypothetical protein